MGRLGKIEKDRTCYGGNHERNFGYKDDGSVVVVMNSSGGGSLLIIGVYWPICLP